MRRFTAALALALCFGAPGFAQRAMVVVELYTSQGCSSCPPADALLHDLAEREDVIALALHVDYWDYIGWKDEFAHPQHAQRQRAYAQKAKRRSIYTPEFIVQGQTDVVGAKPMDVVQAIATHQSVAPPVALSLERSGDLVRVTAEARNSLAQPTEIYMLRYQPKRHARIARGENAGREFVYANVTQDWQSIGIWDGRAPLKLEAPASGELPVVVLIQSKDAGPILAAARLK